jgi:hypothetical protein
MRKLILLSTSIFLVAILFASCKSHKTCPAYGSVEAKTTTKIPA